MTPERPPTDMRKLRREFNNRGLLLVIIGLVVVGGIFVALLYGPSAATASILCLLAGAVLALFVWLILTLVQKVVGDD